MLFLRKSYRLDRDFGMRNLFTHTNSSVTISKYFFEWLFKVQSIKGWTFLLPHRPKIRLGVTFFFDHVTQHRVLSICPSLPCPFCYDLKKRMLIKKEEEKKAWTTGNEGENTVSKSLKILLNLEYHKTRVKFEKINIFFYSQKTLHSLIIS